MPTLKQLRALTAVADTLNFRRAAAACHVTQPALTAQIQELEQRLGAQLVERSRQKVLLTPLGRDIVARARRILDETRELVEEARGAGKGLAGPLRLGVIPTIGPYLLPQVLPAVRAAHPGVQLYLREDRTPALVEALQAGSLDLLLLALPLDVTGTEAMPLFSEPFLLAASADHPLAGTRPVREPELARADVLLLEEGHCLRDQALSVCRHAGASEAMGLQATSLNTLVQMVASGLGVTLLPRMAVPVEVRPGSGLSLRPFAEPAPSRLIGLLWRSTSAKAADFRAFGQSLLRALPRQEPSLSAAGPVPAQPIAAGPDPSHAKSR